MSVSAQSVLIRVAGLLILGIVVRLLIGVIMRAALDNVLAVGVLHQIFDASNINGALVDSLLDDADAGNMTQLAAAVLTVLIAAWLLWRRSGGFAKRRLPLRDSRGWVTMRARLLAENAGRLVLLLRWCGMALMAAGVC